MSAELIASDRAPGLHVGPRVQLPPDAQIAPHVTVYDDVTLGPGVVLGQGCILGRPQQIHPRSWTPEEAPGAATIIGARCVIGSGAIVAAGARVGESSYLGDQVMIRETALLGREVVIGRGSGVAHGSRVGDRTRIQNVCLIGCRTVIGEDVTVGGRVTFIGDSTLARRDRDFGTEEISVARRARIGTAAIIFPPCRIGEEAVVGAAAMVRADVPARTVVAGVPAVPLRLVRDDELAEVWAEHSDGGPI